MLVCSLIKTDEASLCPSLTDCLSRLPRVGPESGTVHARPADSGGGIRLFPS